MKQKSSVINNIISLYGLSIAKMVLPLITLPYLTRILPKDCYGVVSYVKAVMTYMQLAVDFGFMLSGTKDIINCKNDKEKLSFEVGDILLARILLACAAGAVLCVMILFVPILRRNVLYTVLSFVVVFLTCFLFDYLFRGLEIMHVITIRFFIMKGIATALTFVFVKSEKDILWIPILDIIGTLVAIGLVLLEIGKLKIQIRFSGIRSALIKIRESALYFVSDMATSAFGGLNTVLIGALLSESDVADWGLCIQLVSAVQALYTPITNGIYPEMISSKSRSLIKKTVKLFLPLVILGCMFTFFVSKYVLLIVGGEKYVTAVPLLRVLIPVMLFGFLSMLFGWPVLGAIGKIKETTDSTIIAAVIQILGLVFLALIGRFSLIYIAILRDITEIILFSFRFYYYNKYKSEFA